MVEGLALGPPFRCGLHDGADLASVDLVPPRGDAVVEELFDLPWIHPLASERDLMVNAVRPLQTSSVLDMERKQVLQSGPMGVVGVGSKLRARKRTKCAKAAYVYPPGSSGGG